MNVIKKILLACLLLLPIANLFCAEGESLKESCISYKNMRRMERMSSFLAIGTIIAFMSTDSLKAIMASCVLQMINIGVNTALFVGYRQEKRAIKRMIPPVMFLGGVMLGVSKTISYHKAIGMMALATLGMIVKECSDLVHKEPKRERYS